MALNDFANSPPPTATPLSIVNVAAPGIAYYAPASGGGGGAGPNLSVSTLSFPTSDGTTQGLINMNSTLYINDPTTAVIQDYIFITNDSNPPLSSFMSTTMNGFYINGPGGDGANAQLSLLAGPDGRASIWCNNAASLNSTLSIVADNVIIPSNIQVSSINGAAPGGGGAPPADTSTIVNLTSLSTINTFPAPTIANNDLGGWLSYGALSGGWGTWSGTIQLNQTGGTLNSTFQIAPTVKFDGAPYMNGFVQSRAVGVGGLTDIAVLPVNESSITVTANISGTVDNIGILVVGPARDGFYPGII